MSTLFDYMQQTQRLLRDARQDFLDPADLISYINRGRKEVAMRAQCVRILTPISGSVLSWDVTAGGSGYVAPTLTVSAPDFPSGQLPNPQGLQATAEATIAGGVITGILSQEGGSGYFNDPTITITDAAGSGAAATPTLSFINELNQGQEVYPFSGVDLTMNPGAGSIFMVKSISIIYSNYRYSLPVYAFSVYQSMIRQYPFQYQYVPTFASQFGQGTSGSFYVYPLPSQTYQYELDCFCLPQEMIDNQSVEIIPEPWTEAVPRYAAALAFEELQNLNAAVYHYKKFDERIQNYSNYARPGRMINPAGRY